MSGYILPSAVGGDGDPALTGGVTGLALIATAAGDRLVTTTGSQGGLAVRGISGALGVTDTLLYGAGASRPSAGHVEALVLGGQPMLAAFGAGAGLRLFATASAQGPLAAQSQAAMSGLTLVALAATALSAGTDVLFASALQGPGLHSWLRASDGTLTPLQSLFPGSGQSGADIPALTVMTHGGAAYLIAALAADNSLAAYRIGADGRATLTDTLGAGDGLGISTPHCLATLTAHGHDFVLAGAAGSGSLVLAELTDAGTLVPRDQVNDDLDSYFQGAPLIATAVISGRALAVAAGTEGGLTLIEILPDGRMLRLDTLADSAALPLADPSGLVLRASADGGLDIFVTSMTETGTARLHVDFGTLAPARQAGNGGATLTGDARANLLIGGAGNDQLSGGGGMDILVDGAGSDRMTGGSGSDLFVFRADGATDEVMDFQLGIDRLDLSELGRVYDISALGLAPTADGIRITLGNEVILLHSSDHQPIQAASLAALAHGDLFGLWHVPVALPAVTPRHLTGSAGADALTGGDGADRLVGGGGADRLEGGGGNDLLNGEAEDSAFDSAGGTIYRLYQATLGRAPAPAGHYTFTGSLLAGTPVLDIAATLLASTEFQNRYGATSNSDFVTLLFRNVLGRDPAAAGLAYWSGQLDSGAMSRAQVVLGLSESAENVASSAAAVWDMSRDGHQAQWADEVYRLYGAALGRAPALAGLESWTDTLAHGRPLVAVARDFLNSPEFQNRYGSTGNSDFVTLLYHNVLGRDPAAAGLAYWSGQLDSGAKSRAEVVLGLSESAENIARTAAAMTGHIRGFGADDVLIGGPGADILFGGIGADQFVFSASDGAGIDRVAGLEPWDWIELDGFGYGSAAEALGHFSQRGADTVFADLGVTVVFEDTPLSAIHADMLLWA